MNLFRSGLREVEIYGTKGFMRISNAVAPTQVELHIISEGKLHGSKKFEKFEEPLPDWPHTDFGVNE